MESKMTQPTTEAMIPVAKLPDGESATATPTEEDSFTEKEEPEDNEVGASDSVTGLDGLLGLLNTMATSEEEGPMLKTTKEGLDSFGLRYEVHPCKESSDGRRIITFGIRCDSGVAQVQILILEEAEKFVFYLRSPASVPENLRTKAALYLTFVNYGLVIGNFELDLNDGEVRFKTSSHVAGTKLSSEMVKHAVGSSLSMMDRFFPGLMAVLYGGKDPKEAYESCVKVEEQQSQ